MPCSVPRFDRRSLRIATLLLFTSLGAVGCHNKPSAADTADAEPAAVTVQAEHPVREAIADQITADALLAPLSQAAIAPRISAPIRAEYVQRGAHVHKGQLLLTLETRDLQGAAQDTRGALTQAQAAYTTAVQATLPEDLQKAQLDVAQTQANLQVANRTADERRRLLREGAIAGRDTDTAIAAAVQAQTAYDAAVKRLHDVETTTGKTGTATASGQLASAQGRLQSAEAQVAYGALRSPIDGVVTDRPLFPGETAPAGSPVITVMDTSSLLAKMHLAQASTQQMKLGDPAQLEIPGIAAPQPATVSFISPALDPGSTTVEVWLRLANPDGRYKVGTPVHAVIQGKAHADALTLPLSAILPAEDGGTSVLVVGADGKVRKQAVKVGVRASEAVQILSGVSPADTVVTEGGYGLDDGTRVSVGAPKADPGVPAAAGDKQP